MRRHLTLCVVAALLALAVAPTATVATPGGPQPTTTAPANSTTTDDDTTNATASLDAERVITLMQSGRAWTDRERITAWLAAHGERLDTAQATVAYEWVLIQTADADAAVGNATDALDSLTQQLPRQRARNVLADVQSDLPSADVDRLRDRLDSVRADWSDTVSGWLDDASGGTSGAPSTTAPTTTAAPATGDDATQLAAQIDPVTTIRNIDYNADTQTFKLTIHAEIPTRIVISDNLAAMKANRGVTGMSTAQIPQKRLTLDVGTTTVTMQAAEWRGKTAITVATTRGAISINNGVPTGSPFAGSSGTTGWLGGTGGALGAFILAALYKLKKEGGAPVEASP